MYFLGEKKKLYKANQPWMKGNLPSKPGCTKLGSNEVFVITVNHFTVDEFSVLELKSQELMVVHSPAGFSGRKQNLSQICLKTVKMTGIYNLQLHNIKSSIEYIL